jgi:hypothetical protein
MRTGTKWLVAIACGLAAQPLTATDFKEIQVWISSGTRGPDGFSALPDGTLAIVKLVARQQLDHQACGRATREEADMLAGLVNQIPATAPWGRQLWLHDDCSDEPELTLYVTAGQGVLDVRYSLQCEHAPVPAWATKLVDAMRTLQQKHQACSIRVEPSG